MASPTGTVSELCSLVAGDATTVFAAIDLFVLRDEDMIGDLIAILAGCCDWDIQPEHVLRVDSAGRHIRLLLCHEDSIAWDFVDAARVGSCQDTLLCGSVIICSTWSPVLRVTGSLRLARESLADFCDRMRGQPFQGYCTGCAGQVSLLCEELSAVSVGQDFSTTACSFPLQVLGMASFFEENTGTYSCSVGSDASSVGSGSASVAPGSVSTECGYGELPCSDVLWGGNVESGCVCPSDLSL